MFHAVLHHTLSSSLQERLSLHMEALIQNSTSCSVMQKPPNSALHSTDLSLIAKYATTYRKYKPLYEKYKRSLDKEKFLRGHESKIILFEAATRELKRLGAVPIPSVDRVEAKLAELVIRKDTLYAGYNASKQQLREMETIKQNIDSLLPVQREQEPKRSHEIE